MTFDVTGEIKLDDISLVIPIRQPWRLQGFKPNGSVEVILQEKKEKRSLNANAYAWQLIGQIADALKLSNQEVYELMIQRYSKAYTFVVLPPSAVEQAKATFKESHLYAQEIGTCTVNGKEGMQLQLFYGSSTFDTKQMSRLIDGIVSEAKGLDIETATPDEIARMKTEWNRS